MRGLLPYAWRSLAARPARTLLTITGVALGVAVLVAALGVTSGLDASIDRTVASLTGRAQLRVGAFVEPGLSAATLARVEAVPGVALTAPATERRTFLVPTPARPTPGDPVTILGIDPMREPRVRDLALARGAPLARSDEPAVLVSERFALAEGVDLGDELGIQGAGAPVRVRVVGVLAGDGPVFGTGSRTLVVPIATAALLTVPDGGKPPKASGIDGLARIDVVLAAGADPAGVQAAIERSLVGEPYVLTVPREIAESMRASTRDLRETMALLAAITMFGAAFLILNTLGMTVVERVRELGLLRANGATRGQVIRVVIAQALLIGVFGSLLGIALGTVLGTLLAAGLRATGAVALESPAFGPPVLWLGLGAGLVATVVAAIEPARRAAAVSPVTALRVRGDPAPAARARMGWLVAVVAVVAVLSSLTLPDGPLGAGRLLAVYCVLLAAALVTPLLLGPLGRLAGLPFGVPFRLEERLARAAIARDRSRTALTVGALVVGLAMVVGLGVVAANARITATAWLADVVPGDEILTAVAPVPMGDDDLVAELRAIDGVALATPIASFDLAFRGIRLGATAVVGADLGSDGRLTFTAGDRATALAALDAGGAVILPRSRAVALGVGLGDTMAVPGRDGLVELDVVGVVERSFPGRTGEAVLVGWPDAGGRFAVSGADAIAVRYAPGAADRAGPTVAELARQRALTPAPVAAVEGAVAAALDRVFGLFELLAVAAVVVAALGIVNTLSMDVLERVRELGVLRAAGMSRRQAWRSVIVEAGILGVIGGLVGVAAGLAIGLVLVATSGASLAAGVAIPWLTVAGVLAAAVAIAMVAAWYPARTAARRPIVRAVRVE